MGRVIFSNGEFYHIYNRGVDKRSIFEDKYDVERFLQSMREFNSVAPIGSIYENSFNRLGGSTAKSVERADKLVEFVCYCLNFNHYHFILEQVSNGGISEFMRRLGGGYTWYFNNRHTRSGSLLQGKFKAVHVNSNEYLLHLSAYVNLNNRVHQHDGFSTSMVESRSSWREYLGKSNDNVNICKKDIILGQFEDVIDYKKFALGSLQDIREKRKEGLESLLLE